MVHPEHPRKRDRHLILRFLVQFEDHSTARWFHLNKYYSSNELSSFPAHQFTIQGLMFLVRCKKNWSHVKDAVKFFERTFCDST